LCLNDASQFLHGARSSSRRIFRSILAVTGRHAGLRTECILRLLDVVSQKEVAARDAHLSHASGGSAGKIIFYTSFAIVVFVSYSVMLRLLHLPRWMPFAMSAYFVIVFLFTSMILFALRRQAEADRVDLVPTS
jgi:hypothetical protein